MTPESLLRKLFPPMLATLVTGPPRDEKEWTYELKYDGFRAICAITGGEMALWSRNELNLEPRFPSVVQALKKWKIDDIVVDGEVVALDERGTPRFQLLQRSAERERYILFDILWHQGKDVRNLSYRERRALLEKIVRRSPASIELSEVTAEGGADALKHAAARGFEGLMAKRNDSVYEPRRSKAWLKIKALNIQELVIIGFQPSKASPREVGSLHLAVHGDDGALHYAGKVGTGFSSKQREWFRTELEKDVVPASPAKDAPRDRSAVWTRPRFVAQVAFTEWTGDDRLRHPSFLGLRDDKTVDEVVKEKPERVGRGVRVAGRGRKAASAPASRDLRPATRTVNLTHPERVLYPHDHITKQDVADYYAAVAEPMTRALVDRPLALEHWNDGISKPSWFQQNVGREAPAWAHTIETPTRASSRSKVRHLVADMPETLRWLAQMSVLTLHMWSSRGEHLDQPDWLVFDLDPAKGKGIEQAIEAAIVMRGLLENLQLPSVPKTSGKRGIHLLIPLAPGYSHEDAVAFACSIGSAVAQHVPGITVERSLGKRQGRLYLDCLQNGYGKTIVAPYSPRAIEGAPVSAPLKWEEINKKLDPLKFNLRTMPKRLDKVGDLFAPALKGGVKLPKLT